MKRLLGFKAACLFGLMVLWMGVPLHAAPPTVVVSLSSVEDLLSDADLIGEAVRVAGLKVVAEGNINAFTGGAGLAGVDREKPLGIYWDITTLAADDIGKAVVFLPISDAEAFKKLISNYLPDLKDEAGMWTASAGPMKVFAKVSHDYCFICTSKEGLADLADVDALTNEDYEIAIDVNIAGIPKALKSQFLQITESSGRKSMAEGSEPKSQAEAIGQKLGFEWALAALTTVTNDGDHLSFGFSVDDESRITSLDLTLTGKSKTTLASAMAAYGKTSPAFATVPVEDAPFRFVASHPTAWMAEKAGPLFDAMRNSADAEIDKDEKLSDAGDKKAAKDIARRLFDILQATINSGRIDMVVVMDEGEKDTVCVLGGIKLAKGDDAAKLLDDILKLSKENPDYAKVKPDVAKHAGARIHAITPDLSDKQSARFGTEPGHLAIRADSMWISLGGGNLEVLKAALDASAAKSKKSDIPISLRVKPAALVTLMEEDDEALIERANDLDGESGDVFKVEIAPVEGTGVKLHLEFGLDLLKLGAQ